VFGKYKTGRVNVMEEKDGGVKKPPSATKQGRRGGEIQHSTGTVDVKAFHRSTNGKKAFFQRTAREKTIFDRSWGSGPGRRLEYRQKFESRSKHWKKERTT